MLSVVTVDTPLDLVDFTDGVTSLREAIFATNLVGGPDEIEFDFGHDGPETILLTLDELAITDDLTIRGPGADLLTIDASGNDPTPASRYDDDTFADDGDGSRIFAIDDGDLNTLIDVSISGLTLTGGDPEYSQGAIRSLENLTIADSMIVENSGGGIFLGQFQYLVANSGSDVDSEPSQYDGLEPLPTLSIIHSEISGNTTGYEGGGIRGYGQMELTASVISHNFASGGGGIQFGGTASITGTMISENVALPRGSGGGGISARGTMTISESTISGNIAHSGGGGGISVDGTTILTGNNISGNVSQSGGGGIRLRGSAILSDNTISGNSADSDGGGLMMSLNRSAVTITGNQFLDNSAGDDGGGIAIGFSRNGDNAVVSRSLLAGNTAGDLGGGMIVRGGTNGDLLTVESSTITDNSAANSGGGISAQYLQLWIRNSTISHNSAVADGGGIEHASEFPDDFVTIVGSSIHDNTVTGSVTGRQDVRGGGISGSSLAVISSTISGNSAMILGASSGSASGGGISSYALTVTDSTIADNMATHSGLGTGHATGGGIHTNRLTVIGSTISGNAAEGDGAMGGGIYATGALAIASSTISGNRTDHSGGGIYFGQLSSAPNAEAAIAHSTITLNQAGTGGGIFVRSGPLNLDHAIVARNSAGAGRDLTGLLGAQINPRFSLIGDNTDSGLAEAPIGSPDADGNLIGQLAFPGQGGINPYLGPLADNGGSTHTHGLLLGSVAIGAGDPAAVGGSNGVPEFDQRGAPFGRVVDGPIDMGAFEGQPASGSFDGDFNTDDDIDGHDFLTWQRGFGTTVNAVKADGDATGNGAVDANDLAVWQSTFGSAVTVALSVDRFQLSDPDFQFPFWTVGRAGDERPEIVFLKDSIIDDRRADRVDPVSTTARAHGAAVSSRAHRELLPSITRRTHDRLSSAHPKMEPDGQGILLALDKFFALLGG